MAITKNKKQIESMANEIIEYLKKKDMWETDCGIIYNGKHVSHRGETPEDENLKGVMRVWFEGPLNHALNYGEGDPKYTIYNNLLSIMEKYGYYFEFDSHCDFNVYPI
jgi:hypothetical protein